jgi:hypothetical protein
LALLDIFSMNTKMKPDLTSVTLNQLEQLTGISYRTLKKRLVDLDPSFKDGNSIFYDPKEALPLIYKATEEKRIPFGLGFDPTGLDPQTEKAKLDKARREKILIETRILKKELIPADQVENTWADIAVAIRSKILGMPTKIAPKVAALKGDVQKIEAELKSNCREICEELSQLDPNEFVKVAPDDPEDADESEE